jgi:hypothetical protein
MSLSKKEKKIEAYENVDNGIGIWNFYNKLHVSDVTFLRN